MSSSYIRLGLRNRGVGESYPGFVGPRKNPETRIINIMADDIYGTLAGDACRWHIPSERLADLTLVHALFDNLDKSREVNVSNAVKRGTSEVVAAGIVSVTINLAAELRGEN